MAFAAGDILALAPPGPGNAPPVVGRLAAKATDANIVQLLTPTGDNFSGVGISTLTLTDAELTAAVPLSPTTSGIVPGSIITFNGDPTTVGTLQAIVWLAEVGAFPIGSNPFDGTSAGENTYNKGLYYVEVLQTCAGAPGLSLGGERMFLVGPNFNFPGGPTVDQLPLGWLATGTTIAGVVRFTGASTGF